MNDHLFSPDGVPVNFVAELEQQLIKMKEFDSPVMPLAAVSAKRKIDDQNIVRLIVTFSLAGLYMNAVIDHDIEQGVVISLSFDQQYPLQDVDIYWTYVRKVLTPRIQDWLNRDGAEMFRKTDLRRTAIYKKMLQTATGVAAVVFRADGGGGSLFYRADEHGVSSDQYFLTVEGIDVTPLKSTISLAYGHVSSLEQPKKQRRVEVSILVDANDIENWKTIRDFVERQVLVLMRPHIVAVHQIEA